jgi:hypothetical protein
MLCRLGDPEMLAKIMAVDPYFITQVPGVPHKRQFDSAVLISDYIS